MNLLALFTSNIGLKSTGKNLVYDTVTVVRVAVAQSICPCTQDMTKTISFSPFVPAHRTWQKQSVLVHLSLHTGHDKNSFSPFVPAHRTWQKQSVLVHLSLHTWQKQSVLVHLSLHTWQKQSVLVHLSLHTGHDKNSFSPFVPAHRTWQKQF